MMNLSLYPSVTLPVKEIHMISAASAKKSGLLAAGYHQPHFAPHS
jgi:hypothetical protein